MRRRQIAQQRQQLSARRRITFHHLDTEQLLAKPEKSEEDKESEYGRFESEGSERRVSN